MSNNFEYNEALLESMAHFTDAVWKINLDKEEITILSDRLSPEMEGTTITIFDALQNAIRMNPSEEWGKLFEALEVNNLKNLFVSKKGEAKAFIGGECHTVQYAITPEIVHGAVHTVFVTFHDIQAVIDAEESGDRKLDIYKHQMEQMLDGAGMGTWQMVWDYGPRKLFVDLFSREYGKNPK